MKTLKRLFLNEIKDTFIQENFTRLQDYVRSEEILRGEWRFFEITIPVAVTNFKFVHNLGFKPLDVIQTSLIGPGALTWNYSSFTKEFLDLTTTDALTVRAFVGRFDRRNDL